jgi:hypothetical protein
MHEMALYHFLMSHLRSSAQFRPLTVVLSESEWQALRAVEPDAVGWLQKQIRQRLDDAQQEPRMASNSSASRSSAPSWGEDLY